MRASPPSPPLAPPRSATELTDCLTRAAQGPPVEVVAEETFPLPSEPHRLAGIIELRAMARHGELVRVDVDEAADTVRVLGYRKQRISASIALGWCAHPPPSDWDDVTIAPVMLVRAEATRIAGSVPLPAGISAHPDVTTNSIVLRGPPALVRNAWIAVARADCHSPSASVVSGRGIRR